MNLHTRLLAILLVFAVQSHGETELMTIVMAPGETLISTNNIWGRKFVTNIEAEIFSTNTNGISTTPKPEDKDAKMARFIVHYSLWSSLAHVSLQSQFADMPMSRVYSISDGTSKYSTGVPYLYMTPNDPEFRDLLKDPRASMTMTLAQTPYCQYKKYDPEDPRCAQVALTGKFVVLKNTTTEWKTAEKAMFSRHPVMKNWPVDHHWVFCKLDIEHILLVDAFGGNKYPSVDAYFKASPNVCSSEDPMLELAFY